MKKIHKIDDYRRAKIFVRDLPVIIEKFEKILRDLKKHDKYYSVQEVMHYTKLYLHDLNLNLVRYQKILDNKGEVE